MVYNHPYRNILISGREGLDNCFWVACRLHNTGLFTYTVYFIWLDRFRAEGLHEREETKKTNFPKGCPCTECRERSPPMLSHHRSGGQSYLSTRWSKHSTLLKGAARAYRPRGLMKNLFLILPQHFSTSASCIGDHTVQTCCGLGGRSRQSKPSLLHLSSKP